MDNGKTSDKKFNETSTLIKLSDIPEQKKTAMVLAFEEVLRANSKTKKTN